MAVRKTRTLEQTIGTGSRTRTPKTAPSTPPKMVRLPAPKPTPKPKPKPVARTLKSKTPKTSTGRPTFSQASNQQRTTRRPASAVNRTSIANRNRKRSKRRKK